MAGFFDGEGCIMYHRTMTVAISATWPAQLAHFVASFGGKVQSKGKRKRKCKDAYHWRIYGERAAEFCRIMLPYLEEKQTQARLALAIKDTKPEQRGPLVRLLRQLKHVSYEGAVEVFEKTFNGE